MSHSTPEDLIYETQYWRVERSPRPFISREEGGHIRLFPKRQGIRSIENLTQTEAIDLIRLERIVREAMIKGLQESGVNMIWVNIEDLGNWAFKDGKEPQLHIHIFGRAADAQKQQWPEAPYLPDRSTGFYEGNVPLTAADMHHIAIHIDTLFKLPQNQDEIWKLV